MPQVDINWWAILAGGIASMVIGFVWYHPSVLGKTWMKEVGKSEAELKQGAGGGLYLAMFVAALVLSYIMAHFVQYAGAKDWMGGATTGFWAWIGFVATTGLGKKMFQGTSWTLYCVDQGFYLLQFLVIGGIVAGWMK